MLIRGKVVSLYRVSKEARIFLLLNLSTELAPRTRFYEQNQYYIGAVPYGADFNHSSIGAVQGPVESMGRGLRFLYAFELVLSPQIRETKVITIKRSKI